MLLGLGNKVAFTLGKMNGDQTYERLMSLGTIEGHPRTLQTITALYRVEGFEGVLNLAPRLCRKTPVSWTVDAKIFETECDQVEGIIDTATTSMPYINTFGLMPTST